MASRICPAEAFIISWQAAPNLWVASRWVGARTPNAAKVRARSLRHLGVPLKRFDAPARAASYATKKRAGRKGRVLARLIRLAGGAR